MNGSTQLPVETWVQERNPDRYAGSDYVTSFTLQMQPGADGTLTATAPAPGRYKIAARKGSNAYEAYFVIPPQTPVPQMRGADFVAHDTPLTQADKQYATQAFALAKRSGMNWAGIAEMGYIDLDSSNLQVQMSCVPQFGCLAATTTLVDLGWLIDTAHAQGLKVMLYPGVSGKSSQTIYNTPGHYFYVQQYANGTVGDLPAIMQAYLPLVPQVMQSYTQYMLQMAQIAQQHHAEAMVVGNESNEDNGAGSVLWSQSGQWKSLFAQLRSAFAGKIWIGFDYACGPINDLDIWSLADGTNGGSWIASSPPCEGDPAVRPTADQMSANLSQNLGSTLPLELQAAAGLPWSVGEFYPAPVYGISYLGVAALSLPNPVKDNQEIVDYFESQMRAFGGQAAGFFFWEAGIPSVNITDPLRQPELLNAVANWWGGDTAYLAPCMAPNSPAPQILFQDDFACPLAITDPLATNGWQVIPDQQDPQNQVLRAAQAPSQTIPTVDAGSWTDYEVQLRVRLVSGTDPAAFIWFRTGSSNGFSGYSVHLNSNSVGLYKVMDSQTQQLFFQNYSSGGPGQWHSIGIKAIGSTISVSLDGSQVGQYTDRSSPLLSGGFSLGIYAGDASTPLVDFDNITITAVGQMLKAQPAISGPLVNSASLSSGASAPGSLVTVFGSNLTSQPASAAGFPWPTWEGLGGVSLKVEDVFPVPVFFVAPSQYNIQIPWELSGSSQDTLTFVVDGVRGATQTFNVAPYSPGIFALNGQGTGQGAVVIANSGVIAGPTNDINGLGAEPASRGDSISIYCTGLGSVANPPVDGAAASVSQPSYTLTSPTVTIGGINAPVSFSGLAPGYPGLYEVTVQVPANAPTGDAVSLRMAIGGYLSNSVTIAVQ